jgi:hypothetical protein
MKNYKELLDSAEVQQAFAELVSAADFSHFLEGLNQIAWHLSTENAPAVAHNALHPIISFFIELERAEKHQIKTKCRELLSQLPPKSER